MKLSIDNNGPILLSFLSDNRYIVGKAYCNLKRRWEMKKYLSILAIFSCVVSFLSIFSIVLKNVRVGVGDLRLKAFYFHLHTDNLIVVTLVFCLFPICNPKIHIV